MCSSIECSQCGHASRTFDNFMDLSVSIPRKAIKQFQGVKVDLSECLEQFVKPERLEGCGYKCEKCKKEDCMTKTM